MRIEISYHGGSATIGQLWSDYHSLQKHSDAVGQSMQSLIRFAYNMNGGVGCLQDAVSDLHYRSQQESEKQQALGKIEEKLDGFLEHAQSIDKAVAAMVTQNQDEFYQVSGWAKPAPLFDVGKEKTWIDKLATFLYWKDGLDENQIQKLEEKYLEYKRLQSDKEAFEHRYQELLERCRSGNLTEDEKIEAEAMLRLLRKRCSDTGQASEVQKYNELYEAFHPEIAEQLRQHLDGVENDETLDYLKYVLYRRAERDGGLSDQVIDQWKNQSKQLPNSLFKNTCIDMNASSSGRYGSVDDMAREAGKGTNKYLAQGDANIYNFESHKNADGSVDVSFNLSNANKTYTEVTVYNADGSINKRIYIEGQKDPSGVWDTTKEVCEGISDMVKGKFGRPDGESYIAQAEVDLHVPSGGYIQITGDPDEMNSSRLKGLQTRDVCDTIGSIVVETVVGEGSKKIGTKMGYSDRVSDSFWGALGGIAGGATSDVIRSETSSTADVVGSTVCDIGTHAAVSGTPAEKALNILEGIMKANKVGELFIEGKQQDNLSGTGSLYIYP